MYRQTDLAFGSNTVPRTMIKAEQKIDVIKRRWFEMRFYCTKRLCKKLGSVIEVIKDYRTSPSDGFLFPAIIENQKLDDRHGG